MTPAQLAARDGWVCWLCGNAVDPACAPGLPGAPSVDHVVPRSRGGGNDPANLRLAHRRCNTRRGNHLPELAWPERFGALDAVPLWVAVARAATGARRTTDRAARRARRPIETGGGEVVAVLATRELAHEAGRWACERATHFVGGDWTYELDAAGSDSEATALRLRVTGEVTVPDAGRPKVPDPRRSAGARRRRR